MTAITTPHLRGGRPGRLDYRTLEVVLELVTYKPDWFLRVGVLGAGFFLRWNFLAPDVETGRRVVQRGRKWYISPHATPSEVIQTALAAAIAAEEHEAREWFRVQGARPFKPHFNTMDLVELDRQGSEDVRP